MTTERTVKNHARLAAVIELQGGVVRDWTITDPDVEIEIRDYDTENYNDNILFLDHDDVPYAKTILSAGCLEHCNPTKTEAAFPEEVE